MRRRPSLDFTRDAARLVVGSAAGVHVVAINGGAPAVEIPLPEVEEVLAVGDQIWAVASRSPRLHRFRSTGAPVGAPVELPGPGRLFRTAGREVAAAWIASTTSMLVADGTAGADGDAVASSTIPGDPDCVVPVSSARWLLCQRDRVTLRETSSVRWSTSIGERQGRVVDGAILFDGRSVALLVEYPGEPAVRQLVVLGLYEPIVQHRLTLAGVDALRFAPLRGFALMCAARRLLLIDLRFGRVVKEHDLDGDLADLAIDDAAQHIALRYRDRGDVVLLAVSALLASPARRDAGAEPALVADEAAAAAAAIAPPAAPPVETESPAAAAFHRGGVPLASVATLVPRPIIEPTARAETIALLERYRALASALAGRAIAYAWDQGRLAFPTEGGMPFRTEVAGLLGRTSGFAREDVQEAEQAVAQALAAVRTAEANTAPRVPPLEAIAHEFGLSTIAQLILIVVAAPALWGELARLYAILANDHDRPMCDELLVHQILGAHVGRHDVARELDHDAPLIRHGLLRTGEGRTRPFVALTADPIVLRLLPASNVDGDIDDVRIVGATIAFDDLFVAAATKDRIARELAIDRGGAARIVIRGRTGSGRHTVLATAAVAANRRLGVIDATAMLRDLRNRAEQLRNALRSAHVLGLVPCVDGLETIGNDDHAARDTVREVLRAHPGPLAIRLPWDAAPPLDPGYVAFDLEPLSIDQRIACWRATLAEHRLYLRDPAELAIRYGVGPGVMARACAQVAAELAEPGDGPRRDTTSALDAAIRQHLQTRLTATAARVTRLATWSKVVLPPDTLDSLLELIARIKHRRTVYETWGFDSVMSTSRGVTALFEGGPGTGKTLVASAIASELGMDLYRVDVSRIMSKWIGETEQNLAKLFDAAEDGNAIILFDEADSLFAKRTEVRSSVDRYANIEVNYLLQRFDTFEGIAILTSNFGTSIDGAFKRRLSFRLTFPFPDEEIREMLWKAHLPKDVPRAGDFDFAALARRYKLSGGYIRNAVLRAAFRAAEEHVPLTQDHLERAIRAEFREIGKLADSGVLD